MHEALLLGVSLVCIPHFSDQLQYAERVSAQGAGVTVPPGISIIFSKRRWTTLLAMRSPWLRIEGGKGAAAKMGRCALGGALWLGGLLTAAPAGAKPHEETPTRASDPAHLHRSGASRCLKTERSGLCEEPRSR